jgi:hypothetical protein
VSSLTTNVNPSDRSDAAAQSLLHFAMPLSRASNASKRWGWEHNPILVFPEWKADTE